MSPPSSCRTSRCAALRARVALVSGARSAGDEAHRVALGLSRALTARGHTTWLVDAPEELARSCSVDLVHWVGLPAAEPLEGLGVPQVLTLVRDDGLPPRRLGAWAGAVEGLVAPSIAHVVRLREHGLLDAGRLRVVSPGHDLVLPRQRPQPEAYTGRGPLRVLTFGSGDSEDGLTDLDAALRTLPPGLVERVKAERPRQRRAGASPTDAGGGYRGHVPARDGGRRLAQLAAGCHLVALPSRRRESYAVALDEAFALGLPAWVTFGTVAAERFGRGAVEALPARTPEAWAEALRLLLREPWRSAEAFEAVPTGVPTAADAAVAYEALYEDLLAQQAAAARDAA